ncbi:MAG TPA: hypothetical protein PLP34_06200, partial [Chitinophagaceae bacterium]|nr:hypothetical protein [Chitinophagaceae bacterium]
MIRTLIQAMMLLAVSCPATAQLFNDNPFRNSQNKLYWQNRKPHAAYFQQDVAYTIHAVLDEKTDILSADEELQYWNNSPDTLYEVYFHLYQNAFTKGSYLEELHKVNQSPVHRRSAYAEQGLGTTVEDMKADGLPVSTELNNTVLKVKLNKPLLPSKSIRFTLQFKTYFGTGDYRRRMAMYNSFGQKHYNGVHWYPRICVYDAVKGWDQDQHLNKELYGDYGYFDVWLNMASNTIVEATGELKNESEMYAGGLREKLDVKKFASKPWNEKPSLILPYDPKQRKTWHFQANNVHDFAFTCDPGYRIGETTWNGIRCIALVNEAHAS